MQRNIIKFGTVCGIILLLMIHGAYASPDQSGKVLHATSVVPKHIDIKYLDKLSTISPEEQKHREDLLGKTYKSPVPKNQPKIQNIQQPKEKIPAIDLRQASMLDQSLSLLDPVNIYQSSPISVIPPSMKSTTNEPSVGASNGNDIFYTGNWYAALSNDGGNSFKYVDPFADMPDLCCDQESTYDTSRNIFLWYRQSCDGTGCDGQNTFRLGVSNDNGKSWYFYDFSPPDVDPTWAGWNWDYPQLALSNNYLYITTNLFFGTTDAKSVILRFPLDGLRDHSVFNYNYYYENYPLFIFAPVQGATDTMYWGTHNNWENPAQFRIYKWPETGTVTFADRTLPHSWPASYNGQSSCPGPDGRNWCGFADQRISSGSLSSNGIIFNWNVKNNTILGYPNPYIEAAIFNINDLSVKEMPSLWDSNVALQYGFGSPDPKGNFGFGLFYGGRSNYPSYGIGISDDFNNYFHWRVTGVVAGTSGPSQNRWGDYIRIRPYGNHLWYSSGYTLQGGSTGNFADPRYFVFGRKVDNINIFVGGADNALWYRYWNGGSWSSWSSLGGIITSAPGIVSRKNQSIDVFVRGADNALWYRTYDTGTWGAWNSLGGVLTSGAAVASTNPNNLYVFVRGTDNALWYRYWNGVSWSSWNSLGGKITSDPSIDTRFNGDIDIFVRGTDNALWHRAWDQGSWRPWESLGGTLSSGPGAASSNLDVINIFVEGTDSALWERTYDGSSWGNWHSLGGTITSDPRAVSWGLNNLAVFARGKDNSLWYRYWNVVSWSGWNSLGGFLSSGPGVSSWG